MFLAINNVSLCELMHMHPITYTYKSDYVICISLYRENRNKLAHMVVWSKY